MGATLTLARNGVRRGFRSRTLLLLGVVGPLALGAVLALAFGGDGPTIRIGVVDLDRSDMSTAIVDGLVESLDGTQLELDELEAADGDLAPLEQLVEDGEVGAVLVFPDGYAESVTDEPEPLGVLAAGDNATASSIVESIATSIASDTDLQRSVAAALLTAGIDPGEVLADGPVEAVVATEVVDFDEPFDAPLYFGPFAVFLFLGLGVTARGLLRDDADGILDRVRASPLSTGNVVGGAATTVMVQGAIAVVAVVGLSSLVFGADWGTPGEVAVILAAFIVSVAGMLGLVVGVASTELQAESWTNVVAFGFAVLGGSFFGGAVLPGFLGFIGTLTPNGAAMRALVEVGPGGESLADVWLLIAWMLAVGIGGILLGGRLLERRLR